MKIMLIGATGYLGSALFDKLNQNPRNEVIGTGLNNAGCSADLGRIRTILKMNLENPLEIYRTVNSLSPELIIHCGGMVNVEQCEAEQKRAYRVNVSSIADMITASNCRVIYFSTNYVFDGTKREAYLETDVPNSLNYYGFTKKLAEQLILPGKDNLILRVSSVYGYNRGNNKFLNRFLEKNGKPKEEIRACKELNICATYLEDLINNFENIMNETGIVHFPGETISDYKFVKKLSNTMGWNSRIKNVSFKDWCKNGERPRNASLKTARENILSLKRTSLEDGMTEIKRMVECRL